LAATGEALPEQLRRAGLLWPTAASLALLLVLTGLGSWQLERKEWKEALLATIAARVAAPAVDLARAEAMARAGDDIAYLHILARGRFLHDKERYRYAPTAAGLGWHVYTPLELAPDRVVWVNRGFVPDANRARDTRAAGLVAGEVEVSGLVRPYRKKGVFEPNNDVARNLWYWPDFEAMSSSAFASIAGPPFAIDADRSFAVPGGLPQGGVTRLQLPNRHLEYALTWYGLALTLIAVYFSLAAERLRRGRAAA
jgi:surfeit locus 1 family protein